jgi:acid stress-induced BolA-like protein IbaG/YrbA
MVEPGSIEQSIRTGLPVTHIEVTLGGRMREEIHALSMKTYSPDEWASR